MDMILPRFFKIGVLMKKKILVFCLSFIMIFNMTAVFAFAESTEGGEFGGGGGVHDDSYSPDTYIDKTTGVRNVPVATYMGFYDTYPTGFRTILQSMFMYDVLQNSKIDPTWSNIRDSIAILSTSGGTAWSGYGIAYKYMRESLRTPSEIDAYLKSQYSFDDSNNTYAIEPSAQTEMNDSLSDYDYTLYYVANSSYLNPVNFPSGDIYRAVKKFIDNNENCYITVTSYYSNVYRIFATTQVPLGGILEKQYWNRDRTGVALYTENWNQDFSIDGDGNKALISINTQYNPYNQQAAIYSYLNGDGEWVHISQDEMLKLDVDKILVSDSAVSQVDTQGWYTVENSILYRDTSAMVNGYATDVDVVGRNMQGAWPTLFHGSSNTPVVSIPVFTNLNALKKGTIGAHRADGVLDTFTGTSAPTVTASQVQNANPVINNYINSSNSKPNGNGNNNNNDNDDDDDDDDGVSILDIIKKIGNIIGAIIDSLLDIVDRVVQTFNSFVSTLLGFFDDITGLATDNGFGAMFAAFFPYLPPEWGQIVGLVIGLALLSLVIRIFLK